MADIKIISATTRGAAGQAKRDRFLFNARVLLDVARGQLASGDTGLALESAYQAALRTAGARIAASAKIAKRKRLPASAWEKLAIVDDDGSVRAAQFANYSTARSRIISGIDPDPEAGFVAEFLRLAEDFLLSAETEAGWHQSAA